MEKPANYVHKNVHKSTYLSHFKVVGGGRELWVVQPELDSSINQSQQYLGVGVKPPKISKKSILNYPYNGCQSAYYNSESLNRSGEIRNSHRGHPV